MGGGWRRELLGRVDVKMERRSYHMDYRASGLEDVIVIEDTCFVTIAVQTFLNTSVIHRILQGSK